MKRALPVIAGLLIPGLRRTLTCESCGSEFSCGASLKGCWCAEVKLSEATRAELRQQFGDCLCRGCLERFAAPKTINTKDQRVTV